MATLLQDDVIILAALENHEAFGRFFCWRVSRGRLLSVVCEKDHSQPMNCVATTRACKVR